MSKRYAAQTAASLIRNIDDFYEQQMSEFFTANGELVATDDQRTQVLTLCKQASKEAVLACMVAWGSTDFRDDLTHVRVPTLVMHGDADASVPFEGSATRTHAAIPHSELRTINNGPHGCNMTHADEFNDALLDFLAA